MIFSHLVSVPQLSLAAVAWVDEPVSTIPNPNMDTIVARMLEARTRRRAQHRPYSFRFLHKDIHNHQPGHVLELRPLRKDAKLLDGLVWIDASSYLIARMEGKPARGPSWWVHNIDVALDFRAVHGRWLHTALRSTASVRLLGEHTLISHDVEYKMGELEAVAAPVTLP